MTEQSHNGDNASATALCVPWATVRDIAQIGAALESVREEQRQIEHQMGRDSQHLDLLWDKVQQVEAAVKSLAAKVDMLDVREEEWRR